MTAKCAKWCIDCGVPLGLVWKNTKRCTVCQRKHHLQQKIDNQRRLCVTCGASCFGKHCWTCHTSHKRNAPSRQRASRRYKEDRGLLNPKQPRIGYATVVKKVEERNMLDFIDRERYHG